MKRPLEKITIEGFKSIKSLKDFELNTDINVLIGANGSGKSNFIDIFRMMRSFGHGAFQKFATNKGATTFFYESPKATKKIEIELNFSSNGYAFSLTLNEQEQLLVSEEQARYETTWKQINHFPSQEPSIYLERNEPSIWGTKRNVCYYVHESISSWVVYHFHDTSSLSPLRLSSSLEVIGKQLNHDGENIASFLWQLKHEENKHYSNIVNIIQRIAPYFEDFILPAEDAKSNDKARLTWKQKGLDAVMGPSQLSDGTLRFIALATAFLQPYPPSTIIIDEPELGLHPEALLLLSELIHVASHRMQVVIATQSPALVNAFSPEHMITVSQINNETHLNRLNTESLTDWLEEYTVSDLWMKGVLQGGVHDA